MATMFRFPNGHILIAPEEDANLEVVLIEMPSPSQPYLTVCAWFTREKFVQYSMRKGYSEDASCARRLWDDMRQLFEGTPRARSMGGATQVCLRYDP